MMMNSYQTDGKSLMASSSSSSTAAAARVMEKPISQEQPLMKCPRCDSSNTKFCYYNNYSLSQPRHFCKACKRYWTRGGTLRNVPVGGGCRKNNKRIRRSSASASSSSSPAAIIDVSSSSTSPAISSAPLQIPAPTPPPQTKTQINPLFYGLPINPSSDLNPPFPRLFGSRVSSSESYDNNHDSMISSPGFLGGLGENGFVNSSSNPLLSSYPVFRSSSSSIITTSPITTSTTLASLIASSLDQRKFNASGDITNRNFLGMPSYNGELVMAGNIILENGEFLKGESQNRLNWNGGVPMNNHNLQTEGVVNINYSTPSDPSFPWNSTAWMDPSSMGSSLPAFSHNLAS